MFKHLDWYAKELVFLSKYSMKLFIPTKSEKYKHHLNPLLLLFASNYNDFGSSGQRIKEIQSLPQIPF